MGLSTMFINRSILVLCSIMFAVLLVIATYPERPAELLTPALSWKVEGPDSSKVPLYAFSEQFLQVRKSEFESSGGLIFRTWTPESGVVPLAVTSVSFRPANYMAVLIHGNNRTTEGQTKAIFLCESNGQRVDIFRGSVGNHVVEAIVELPKDWCPENIRLEFVSTEKTVNLGVGAVFKISYLSYLKSSFLGRLPYLICSIVVYSLIMLSGASLVSRLGYCQAQLPAALISLGLAALSGFYIASNLPTYWNWAGAAFVITASLVTLLAVGSRTRKETALSLAPYLQVWCIASLMYFTVLGLASNSIGSWEPNYRFWPAIWGNENQTPWMFAEALRHGWPLRDLFGGFPIPTDNPPLMTAAYLLLADVFGWLQVGNDGPYLTGQAYNAASIVLSSLWVPVCWWLLVTFRKGLDQYGRTAITVFVGCLPFILFSTIYGWPKALSSAFALAAFGVAWLVIRNHESEREHSAIVPFFLLCAFCTLADISTALFLIPLVIVVFFWKPRRNLCSTLVGLSCALILIASWDIFKLIFLPSADPFVKYMLSGNYGLGHPEQSIWSMISTLYSSFAPWQWLDLKKVMLLQSFIPTNQSVELVLMNSDDGAGYVDRLRAWDIMMLSKGNLALLFVVISATWGALRAYSLNDRYLVRNDAPFLVLIAMSLVTWLLMNLVFMSPTTIPNWPQVVLFGFVLGGAVVVHGHYPSIFAMLLCTVMFYTGSVWLLSPLNSAVSVDHGAALVLVLLGLWFLYYTIENYAPQSREVNVGSMRGGLVKMLNVLVAKEEIQRIGNVRKWSFLMRFLTLAAFLFFSYITFRFIQEPLVDGNSFRQTQTAITSYWMLKEGWSFAYQTPVAGFPWSIPFEFPIYQAVVAALAFLFDFNLGSVGRFISYVFLVACAWPAFLISRRLNLAESVPWVFCALLWTSPLNVFWGRTFMIETAALFFAFACIPYAIDLIRGERGFRVVVMYLLLATMGVLQKSTTGGPVLLFLFLICTFIYLRKDGWRVLFSPRLVTTLAILCAPVVVGLAWAYYADLVKEENPFGAQLTSKALTLWNFGSLDQKLSFDTWKLLLWERTIRDSAAGFFGLSLLLLPWFGSRNNRHYGWLALAAVALFLLPLLIFTNLHFVHNYYQTACVLFFIAAVSIVTGGWMVKQSGVFAFAPLLTIVLVLSNIVAFYSGYGIVTARPLEEQDPIAIQAYKVGRYLRENTREGTSLMVYGQGYSSEIPYQAQRKSMAPPTWFKEYDQTWLNPQEYLGDVELGAIVICPTDTGFPSEADVHEKLTREKGWRLEKVMNCQILLRNLSNGIE